MPGVMSQDRFVGRLAHGLAAGLLGVSLASNAARADDPVAAPAAADEPAMIRDGFETPRVVWHQEQTDATINLQAHDVTDRAAHEGRTSEHFRFTAGIGSGFYVSYPLPKVPVTDALKARVYVRANRGGVQVFARVVLPSDTDPETNQPSFLLVSGTIYDNIDRWQHLEVIDLNTSLERQARVLRASTKRPVSLEGAYIEQLVVNLFAGAGDTEVFLDELSVGPVPAALVAAHAPTPAPEPAAGAANAAAAPGQTASTKAILARNRLKKRAEDGLYHDWFFTAIHAPGADLASLRNAGFDVSIEEANADPKRLRQAVDKGFLLMLRVPREGNGEPTDPETVFRAAAVNPLRDSVLAWDLGDRLGRHADPKDRAEELKTIRSTVSLIRTLPPGTSRLTTGLIDDEVRLYSRAPQNLDLMGVYPPAWGGALSPMNTFTYLRQRRNLAVLSNAEALFWAMLPATPTPEVATNVWGRDVPPAWGVPVVQPEQLRWMTYAAISAGYRGVAFDADADLTRAPGRINLLEMAMLNAEIDLSESILANGRDPIAEYKAYDPDPPIIAPNQTGSIQRSQKKPELKPLGAIRAHAIGTRDRKGVLLFVADYAGSSQYQPPQAARNDVTITVMAPENAEAFEISPGQVRVLEHKRDVGGIRITLPEFDTSALILVTTDLSMAERVEAVVNGIRPRAVQMAIEQAELKLQWATDINARLATDGHPLIDEKERKKRRNNGGTAPTDDTDLLNKCQKNIATAREFAERLDWETAWLEARRASRPLRKLMNDHWTNAVTTLEKENMLPEDVANEDNISLGRVKRKGPPLITPVVGAAPLISFGMLPQFYVWVDWMKTASFGANLIPSGSFDEPEWLKEAGWEFVPYQFEGVKSQVEFVEASEENPKLMLKMTVMPKKNKGIDELIPFLDFPAAAIRSPAVKVKAGQFLRFSVYVRRPKPIADGIGGVVIRDSIGGEALQFVTSEAIPKRTKVVWFRRVAEDGDLTVTLGLAGYDSVFFDDLEVQRVEAAPTYEPPDVAQRRRRQDSTPRR